MTETVVDAFLERTKNTPSAPAIRSFSNTVTFGELDNSSRVLAAAQSWSYWRSIPTQK
jgi:hypothetical protein